MFTQAMADLSFTQTTRAMNQDGVTAHDKNPAPPIWVVAARNNKKTKQVIYRVNGVRVSKQLFDAFKGAKKC
jgi:hypothetical protein